MDNRILIDVETGQVLSTLEPGDRFKVTKAEIIENFKKKKAAEANYITINEREPFIKVYSNTLFNLSKSLTGTESQFINYLIQYIRYHSGILAYKKGKTLTRKAMAAETGLSVRAVDRILQGLQDKEVIGKHKTGQDINFTVNPFIFMRGDKVSEILYIFYRNSRWAKKGENKQ